DKDDTVAMQTAFNASAVGDVVFIPSGTFIISRALIAKSSLKVQGESQAKTIIEFSGDSSLAMIDLSNTSNVEITSLTLDGNMKSIASGIYAKNGSGHTIHFITLQNLAHNGFGPHGILFD